MITKTREIGTIVLVPGLALTASLFEPVVPTLAGYASIHYATIDRDDTIEGMAERLLAEAPTGPLAVVGLSMGGYVALEAVRRAPERVTRLALLDTNARADTAEASDIRERLVAAAEAGRYDEVTGLLFQRLVAPSRQADQDVRARVFDMARATGVPTFARQQRAIMARRDRRVDLPAITARTLVLVGEDDVITPPHLSEEIAQAIPGARLVTLAGCGHLPTLEAPEATADALQRWLAD